MWVHRSDNIYKREGTTKLIKKTKHPLCSKYGRSLMNETGNSRWRCSRDNTLFEPLMGKEIKFSKFKLREDPRAKFMALIKMKIAK